MVIIGISNLDDDVNSAETNEQVEQCICESTTSQNEGGESNSLKSVFTGKREKRDLNTVSTFICGIIIIVVLLVHLFKIDTKAYLEQWIDFTGIPTQE